MAKPVTDEEEQLTPKGEGANPSAGTEPKPSEEEELDLKTKAGFQKALQEAREEKKKFLEDQAKKIKEIAELRKLVKESEMADMDESEKLTLQLNEKIAENAKLQLKVFVNEEIAKRKLDRNDPLLEIVVNTPWAIPEIQRMLGDSPTWEDIVREVEEKLPSYLDALVSKRGEQTETTPTEPAEEETEEAIPPSVDRERPAVTSPKRTWTRAEIAALSLPDYQKHKAEISKALAEGRVV